MVANLARRASLLARTHFLLASSLEGNYFLADAANTMTFDPEVE